MSTSLSATDTATVERELIKRIADAKLRLRFDRVVRWLVSELKAGLAEFVPECQALLFTITAPIKLPTKTAAELKTLARGGLSSGEFRGNVHGNEVRIRRLEGIPKQMPRVVAFVHNPESDANLILKLVETRMFADARSARGTSDKSDMNGKPDV